MAERFHTAPPCRRRKARAAAPRERTRPSRRRGRWRRRGSCCGTRCGRRTRPHHKRHRSGRGWEAGRWDRRGRSGRWARGRRRHLHRRRPCRSSSRPRSRTGRRTSTCPRTARCTRSCRRSRRSCDVVGFAQRLTFVAATVDGVGRGDAGLGKQGEAKGKKKFGSTHLDFVLGTSARRPAVLRVGKGVRVAVARLRSNAYANPPWHRKTLVISEHQGCEPGLIWTSRAGYCCCRSARGANCTRHLVAHNGARLEGTAVRCYTNERWSES